MIVLGINGYKDRGHDGGAAIIVDGDVHFAIEEEKLINKRHAYDCCPIESINQALLYEKCNLDDVDLIVYGWDYPQIYNMINQKFISNEEMSKELFDTEKYASKIKYVDHHVAHALSSFCASNYDKALTLVIDGQGEYMGTSLFLTEKNKLPTIIMQTPISLGYFYAAITKHIGFHGGEEGKTMGLASYGKPLYLEQLRKYIYYENGELHCKFLIKKVSKDEEDATLEEWEKILQTIIPARTGKISKVDEDIMPYANLASSAQILCEEIVTNLINDYSKKYNINHICIAGGVGLNCPINSAVEKLPFITDVFIQPAANDGGVALGSAYYGALLLGDSIKDTFNVYSGTSFSDEEIEKELIKLNVKYQKCDNIADVIATKLANGEIVANFQGRLEYGPRALGNRSLLASASDPNMLEKLNNLKGREVWRPLAPVVLFEKQNEYFDYNKESLYMLKNAKVISSKIPAVTHVDYTARIQSITQKSNKLLYDILNEYNNLTGCAVLINTSFNVKGEPLVNSPKLAIESARRMHINNLSIGNFFVSL